MNNAVFNEREPLVALNHFFSDFKLFYYWIGLELEIPRSTFHIGIIPIQ